jgi:glycosyltransferase involved in cell wall biosynthesis
MPDLYRAADLFTLASLHEMFGIVLLEALATGLPVLCHDAPGFRSVVGAGGVYRDLSVPGQLAAGLQTLSDPELRRTLSQAARRQVEAQYAEAVVIREIRAMYDAVLQRERHG